MGGGGRSAGLPASTTAVIASCAQCRTSAGGSYIARISRTSLSSTSASSDRASRSTRCSSVPCSRLSWVRSCADSRRCRVSEELSELMPVSSSSIARRCRAFCQPSNQPV
jgi:hypothetical protein